MNCAMREELAASWSQRFKPSELPTTALLVMSQEEAEYLDQWGFPITDLRLKCPSH